MVFLKASEKARRAKASESCKARNEETRQRKMKIQKFVLEPAGRRIIDLSLIAREMWCVPCDSALSFKFLEEERICGLNSIFKVRCSKCLQLYSFHSNLKVPSESETEHPLCSENCKFALGCLDTGVGHEQLNKLLSIANLPTIDHKTLKRAEERVGPHVVQTAREACVEAIAEERMLTLSAQRATFEISEDPHCSTHLPSSTSPLPAQMLTRRKCKKRKMQ